MNENFSDPEFILAKAQELHFRAEANPGDAGVAQDIQDFTLAACLVWKPQFDRLFAIAEDQQRTIREQTATIHDLVARIDALVASLQRYQAVQMTRHDQLTLVRPPDEGASHA